MISEELRNLAREIDAKMPPDVPLLVVPRPWLLKVRELLADMADDAEHLEAQPVPQRMRGPSRGTFPALAYSREAADA